MKKLYIICRDIILPLAACTMLVAACALSTPKTSVEKDPALEQNQVYRYSQFTHMANARVDKQSFVDFDITDMIDWCAYSNGLVDHYPAEHQQQW